MYLKTQEFVEQLEVIDNYISKNKFNHKVELISEELRKNFIDSYQEQINTICTHTNLIEEGYFNYSNGMFVESDCDNAKYRKCFCPTCKIEKVYENKIKTYTKIK